MVGGNMVELRFLQTSMVIDNNVFNKHSLDSTANDSYLSTNICLNCCMTSKHRLTCSFCLSSTVI